MAIVEVTQMKKEARNKLLLLGLLSLILITPVIIRAIYQGISTASKDTLLLETAKAFLQLIGVAILGGGFKLLGS